MPSTTTGPCSPVKYCVDPAAATLPQPRKKRTRSSATFAEKYCPWGEFSGCTSGNAGRIDCHSARCRDDDGDSDGGILLLIGVHYLIVGCSSVPRQIRPAPTPLPLPLCVLLPPSQIRAPSRRRTRPPTARPQS